MLTHLHIKNYALIDELDIDFHHGFSVITGETGAGKSILLGAIGLLLGQRADSKSVQDGSEKCIIEAEFNLDGFGLEDFFEDEGFDFDKHLCIIRRELTASGKSRAFINDTPATVAQLKQLGAHIIDIHSQHQNLLLANENYQMEIIDTLGGNIIQLNEYKELFDTYRKIKSTLAEARSQAEKDKENEDYLQFQFEQLQAFNPTPGEDEILQEEIATLSHAEDIKQALFQTTALMNQESCGIVSAIRQSEQLVQGIERHFPQASEWISRLHEAYVELKDVATEIENAGEQITYDPARLDQLNNRINELYTLEKKHHVSSAEALCLLKEEFGQRLERTSNNDAYIAQLEQELSKLKEALTIKAATLTQTRQKAATDLEKQMSEMLKPLGMPNAQMKVCITPLSAPAEKGMDKVNFLFSANKNGTLRSVAEVASGGEIARLMLSLKTLVSTVKQLPTIIFDEIDTGVSGTIAECMAQMMQQMASTAGMQVISITHLPQIAALGNHHYRVYKEDTSQSTHSHIQHLDAQARIQEIAHMLSGAQVTQAAIDNAKQLLKL